jgi:hypothetical protein
MITWEPSTSVIVAPARWAMERMTEEGFSPPQAAGFQPRRLSVYGFSQQSRDTTGLSPRCENGCQDTLNLANRIVFAGSVVNRSHGEKHERTLDEVRSA